MTIPTETFRAARDFLVAQRTDYETAYRQFEWPRFEHFNFALDWFDAVLAVEQADQAGLRIIEDDGTDNSYTFAELSRRSNQVANWLASHGVTRGTRVLVVLGNQVELWETTLAVMKLGAVLIPATTLLTPADMADRVSRANAGAVITRPEITVRFDEVPGSYLRVVTGPGSRDWLSYADSAQSPENFVPDGPTRADDPLLVYFTSGTTALPKLVEHTHESYPVGHLSTMYWIGLQPGDVHLNVSSPGWAKHAWSCVFAPWIAGATTCLFNYERFDARAMLDVLRDAKVTTFCAPPTVWRMLIQQEMSSWSTSLRELVGAGEPLNAEVIDRVQRAWGLTIRDGFGQTETTVQVGNSPGQKVKAGSMGRPIPGYAIDLVDPTNGEVAQEGEICVRCEPQRPVGVMAGYRTAQGSDDERNEWAFAGGRYHTGDLARRDEDGYITYVGRTDDVFKSSDYRISPFELESVLIEHPAVAEAAVVPAPDEVRLAIPKAYVALVAGQSPSKELAGDILRHCRERLAPYKRVRRLEFAELPKTISGKIRRVELRAAEQHHAGARPTNEYREEDFAQ
ncbi:MAG TPA: AMP-binding protein [Acidimicrobiales bacterium]|nr:AMP-binding protein [Acidimicrobiales bacterium]